MNASIRTRLTQSLALVLGTLLIVGWSMADGTPELPDPGHPRMTRDQQQKLGLQAAGQVYTQMPVLPDSSPETKYVQALGKKLVATIPSDRTWPYQFHVVAQKEINAFALPGGPMFINIGTIVAADNEAELAGVMAHEMSHVYMQHSAKQQEKGGLLEGLAGIAGAVAGNMGGAWGDLAQAGIQFGAGSLVLKYSRADEAQADAVGAIILWKAGYNPVALANFFQRLQAQGGGSIPQFLSDHPNPGNRTAAIQKEISAWPPRKYLGDSAEFASVKTHAATVPSYDAKQIEAGAKTGQWAAENRKNGAVFADAPEAAPPQAEAESVPWASWSDVQPSGNFRIVDLGAFRMERPENWEVIGDQKASATVAPRAGVSAAAVAYGVVIRAGHAPKAGMNPGDLTASIVQSLRRGDRHMKQIGDIESIPVGAAAGGSVELETVSPMSTKEGRAQRERDWLVAFPRGHSDAIFLVFVSPLASYDDLRPTFERMLQSIQF